MSSSMREKLKKANAVNASTRGNTSTDDTVFGDFANRKDDNSEEKNIDNTDLYNNINNNNNNNNNGNTNNNDSIAYTDNSNNVSNINNTKNEVNAINPYNISNNSNLNINNNNINNNKKTEPTIAGKGIMIPLNLSANQDKYLSRKAMSLGISMRQVFKDVVSEEIKNSYNGAPEGDLAESYRVQQRNKTRKTIMVDEDLKIAIEEAARRYYMRPTAFVSYAFEVAMIKEGIIS